MMVAVIPLTQERGPLSGPGRYVALMLRTLFGMQATPSSAPDVDGLVIQNLGSVTLYLGGSTVTANTASTDGLQVAANGVITVPTTGASAEGLYGITASSTANVAYLYPG
jgi:hypothetical protein